MSQGKTQLAAPEAGGVGGLALVIVSDGLVTNRPLPRQGSVRIGRAEECDIAIEAAQISRHHAQISVNAQGVRVEDLGSTNGTRVRDRLLHGGESAPVALGDVIEVGSAWLMLQRQSAPPPSPAAHGHAYLTARLAEECARAAGGGHGFAFARLRAASRRAEPADLAPLAGALAELGPVGVYAAGELEILLLDAPATDEELREQLTARARAHGLRVAMGVARYGRDGRHPEALLAAAAPGEASAAAAPAGEPAAISPATAEGGPRRVILAPVMLQLYRMIDRIAAGDIAVLITGETGAGKEVVVERLHRASPRRRGPFLRLNCAALTETLAESELFGHQKGAFTGADKQKTGLIEAAAGGTIFLDEVGELPLGLQAKLLRVVEEGLVTPVGAVRGRPIDVRFVSATNRDLTREIAAGRFREDLYFRLSGVSLMVPPLRERIAEIEPLARSFLAEAAARHKLSRPPGLSSEAVAWLQRHRWPGNVRELRNVITRAQLLSGGDEIEVEHLAPADLDPWTPSAAPDGDDAAERKRVLEALARTNGNQTRAAKLLGMARSTLVKRLEAFDLPRPRKA